MLTTIAVGVSSLAVAGTALALALKKNGGSVKEETCQARYGGLKEYMKMEFENIKKGQTDLLTELRAMNGKGGVPGG